MTRVMDHQEDTLDPESDPDLNQEPVLGYRVRIGETLAVDMVVVTMDQAVDIAKEVW